MSNIDNMKARLKRMRTDYYDRHYFGKLSDLLADISSLEVQIGRAEESKNDEKREDTHGNLDDE